MTKTSSSSDSSRKPCHVAIDGPVAAGKGVVARLIANRLGFLYVDTGAMYRVLAFSALEQGIALNDEESLVALLKKIKTSLREPNEKEKDGRFTTVLVDDRDVSWQIRREEVSQSTSKVSALPRVRQELVKQQQRIAKSQDVVMEGRDITYKVLPQANLKIFLTASDVVRAKRRHLQLQTRGDDVAFEEVFAQLIERDRRDSNRNTDPLQIVDDAWVIDSSDLTVEQVVSLIITRVKINCRLEG